MFKDHLHSKLIKEKNTELLKYIDGEESYILDYHVCGESHPC
jgi:hypothetical protein